MLISDATMRAMARAAASERDAVRAFIPADPLEAGTVPAAAPPDAYFVTRDERGRALFTRGGRFTIRAGALVDAGGEAVLGYAKPGSPLEPMRIGAIDRALGLGTNVRIEADGSVTYDRSVVDPRSRAGSLQRVTIGKVALARFAPGTALRPVDGRHLAAPQGAAPHLGTPADGNFPELIAPPAAQNSGDLDDALERMQEAYLAVDAIRATVMAQRGVEKTAMDLLK